MTIGVAGAVFPGWDRLMAAEKKAAMSLSPARFAVLDAVAETIIPRTDTPGARDALVPQRFDALMANWASAPTRAEFDRILDGLDAAARPVDAKGLAALPAPRQLEVVAAYDKANMTNPAYVRFKGLILSLYYLSEPGATVELRYEQTPGVWQPSVPVTPETRAWAVDVSF